MVKNNIYPWAQGINANVLTDEEYANSLSTNGVYENGVKSGIASSAQINKTLRQATVPASGLSQFLVNTLNIDVNDNDDIKIFSDRITNSILKLAQINPFNPSFANAIGGYRKYAIVSGDNNNFWVSTKDNNLTIPGNVNSDWVNLFDSAIKWANSEFLRLKSDYPQTVESDVRIKGTFCVEDKNIIIDRGNRDYVNGVLNLASVIWMFDGNNIMSMFATHDMNEGKKITIQSKSGDKVTNSIILREDGTVNASNFSGENGNIKKIFADELRPLSGGKIDNYSELYQKGKNIVIDATGIPYVNDVLNMPSVIWQFNENNTMSIFATHDLNEGKKITIQSKINGVVYNAIVLRENGTIECNELQSKDISVTDGTLNINSTNRDTNENGLIVGNSSIHFNLVNRPGQTGGIYLQENFKNNKTDLVFYSGNSFYTMDDQGTITGKNFNGVSMSAFCADLAEYYIADERYDPGTLVRIGGEKEITRASIGGFFYGVISTAPAYIMNTAIRDRKNALPVALAGRIPVLVTGMIDKGDPVTISEISGVARKAKSGERHIGFSLENSHETSIRPVECVIRQD